jgi:hypothetical protein
MLKMAPTEMLMSTLLEPSSGSVKSPVAPAIWLFFDEILIDW